MRTPKLRHLAGLTAVLVIELAQLPGAHAAPAAPTAPVDQAGTVHVVAPGQSIQAAVDAAEPGDTIEIQPGVYRENIQITTDRLTLHGAGESTVLSPADQPSDNACGAAGHGICVTGTDQQPVSDVRISSLKVTGFPKNGIWGSGTDRMTVRDTVTEQNGQQGMGQELSTRGAFVHNVSRDNEQSGVFLANTIDAEGGATDALGTVVAANELSGNRSGVVVRRLRDLTVERNTITGNCAGVFIVGDESTPRAGDLTVRYNVVTENNAYCAATDRLPFIQGAGIVLTGAEGTRVTANQVHDNVGTSPMSGGIVLYTSVVGAPNAQNAVSRNVLSGNKPADLADRDKGEGNTFTENVCELSEPTGRC
ncbi:right-handed parallel beta-helix repeat-containing protein [Streptomyces sp. S465]|uniref:right-handed parallel beta-helix repeat-containing protein n=1 Tax=Streptomyces sp. S465 TaxID=2979468 RepID=UPI0022A80FFC|nr:right-handed parallel beta-helix repeat-containing protein [Streptomyces sp. S465]WAP59028.1 right-handed parallel beta-helix repeat-containing protein [Streptomyces sp. S465]